MSEGFELSRAEVAQLWWFSDGAIMDPKTRDRLRSGWGLCSRHSWGYFVVECELRWQPLGAAVLYQDLLDHAVSVSGRRFRRRSALGGRPWCPTCEYGGRTRGATGFSDEHRRVNLQTRSREFVAGCRSEWLGFVCPSCVAGGGGVPCRPHLASGAARWSDSVLSFVDSLREPLERCMRSMTHGGPSSTSASRAALVGAVGWFAGWSPGLVLADRESRVQS